MAVAPTRTIIPAGIAGIRFAVAMKPRLLARATAGLREADQLLVGAGIMSAVARKLTRLVQLIVAVARPQPVRAALLPVITPLVQMAVIGIVMAAQAGAKQRVQCAPIWPVGTMILLLILASETERLVAIRRRVQLAAVLAAAQLDQVGANGIITAVRLVVRHPPLAEADQPLVGAGIKFAVARKLL